MRAALIFFLLLGFPALALAQTVYRGEETLWSDTVWNGEVLIDGIVTVAPQVTLQVQPGTIVRFTRFDSNGDDIGEHELFIQGRLQALGTEKQPVLFTSAEAVPRQGDWGALNMMASQDGNRLEHCVVEYAYRGFHAHFAGGQIKDSLFRYNRRGAQFQESQVTIDGCRFVDNLNGLQFRDSTVTIRNSEVVGGFWGVRGVYCNLTMTGSRIADNRTNGLNLRDSELELDDNRIVANRRGLYLQRCTGTVRRNRLSHNSEYGLFVEEGQVTADDNRIKANGRGGVRILNAQLELTDNDLGGNDLYALVNDGDTDLQIVGNAWGTDDPLQLATLIRDGADRPGCGKVSVTAPQRHHAKSDTAN